MKWRFLFRNCTSVTEFVQRHRLSLNGWTDCSVDAILMSICEANHCGVSGLPQSENFRVFSKEIDASHVRPYVLEKYRFVVRVAIKSVDMRNIHSVRERQ